MGVAYKQSPDLSGLKIRNGVIPKGLWVIRANQEVKAEKRALRSTEGLVRGGAIKTGAKS